MALYRNTLKLIPKLDRICILHRLPKNKYPIPLKT